jgi:uncharacterized protein (DUF362 family)/Pyruvate/2-oxoacid:ferredoxin oxidoreductase delta subunit
MQKVAIEKVASYNPEAVEEGLKNLLAPFGGIKALVRPGERVLLKPNMLSAKPPEAAVTTHPAVLRGVIRLVQSAGGVVLVGDSPGFGSLRAVARRSGMLAVIEECGAELVEFSEVREVVSGGIFKRFEIAAPYLDADRIINLPKLKTHEMMTLTCGVKNIFGILVGAAKPAWHLQAGFDRELFARVLLEIYQIRKPDLTIVDAITAMEGNGPGSGDPREVGLLIGGTNPVAVDLIAGEIAGIPKKLLFVEQQAKKLGLPGSEREQIEISGVDPAELNIRPFRLPPLSDVEFGLPRFIKDGLRKHLTTRPAQIPDRCVLCGVCVKGCPPGIIRIEGRNLKFDYDLCIRCFCCRELCPEAALDVRKGILLKIFGGRKNGGRSG